jgi:predicted aspartyl protease
VGRRRANLGRVNLAGAGLAGAGLALLAGAASAQAPIGGPDCKAAPQARMPLRESRGRFSVEVSLDGQPLAMLVDTGAQRAALSPQAADRLRLPIDASRTFHAIGVDGRTVGEHPRVARAIRFGPVVWPRYALQTVNVVRPEQAGDRAAPDGVIGADMLSAYDVELDFPARTLTLYAVSGCSGDFIPWPGRHEALTPLRGPPDLFIIPITLNGHGVRALLDTGSNTSSLGLGAARALGVDAAALKGDPADSYVGSKGVPVGAHRHRFDSLAIGSARVRGPRISVRDADFSAFDMLLGMDYLASRKLWLSYRTHQVFIDLAGPAPAP